MNDVKVEAGAQQMGMGVRMFQRGAAMDLSRSGQEGIERT